MKEGHLTIESSQGDIAQVSETNQGKDFISSNITLSYGGEVWRDPKRILIDALQNHLDAKKDQLPQMSFRVYSSDGQLATVSGDQLQTLDKSWQILGVEISDTGNGYPTPYLAVLGETTKTDDDIGKFGEGLKMLAASAIRQGMDVSFSSRDWVAVPTAYQASVKDYETSTEQTFPMLGYRMTWQPNSRVGSSTQFSLINGIQSGQVQLTTEQISAIQAKTRESTWGDWVEVLDPRNADNLGSRGLERYTLSPETEQREGNFVGVIDSTSGRVYEKGLLIPGQIDQPMMFSYNIDGSVIDTRERNNFSKNMLDAYLQDYFDNLKDPEVMRTMLEKAKADPNSDFYEYKFLRIAGLTDTSKRTQVLWRQAYYDVFGADAILSEQPELRKLEQAAYSRAGLSEGAMSHYAQIRNIVANEAHLEGNLVILPSRLQTFFNVKARVYKSQDYLKDIEAAEVEVPPEDKSNLFATIKTLNGLTMAMLESMDSNQQRREALARVVPSGLLDQKVARLRDMAEADIRIKNASFPAMGMVAEEAGKPVVYLNEKVLGDPNQVVDTYIHELSHFLSGKGDYTIGFQRFMMMLALSGRSQPLAA